MDIDLDTLTNMTKVAFERIKAIRDIISVLETERDALIQVTRFVDEATEIARLRVVGNVEPPKLKPSPAAIDALNKIYKEAAEANKKYLAQKQALVTNHLRNL